MVDGERTFLAVPASVLGRLLLAFLGTPLLVIAVWVGQGCIDDPCDISRVEEWRGVLLIFVAAALGLRFASARYWLARCVGLALTAVPAYVANRDLEPRVSSVYQEAPGVAEVSWALLLGYLGWLVVTFVIELWVIRKARRHRGQ